MAKPVKFTHDAMGTVFEVMVLDADPEYARQAAAVVFLEIDRLNGLLSHYDACSDIGQINALKPGESVRVDVDVVTCLQLARRAARETGGAFDITVGPLVKYWRKQSEPGAIPDPEALAAARAVTGLDRLIVDAKTFTVSVRKNTPARAQHVGVDVDLGGIGKGFALDRVKALLDDWTLDNVLIHSGTSTALARGAGEEGQGWAVGVGGKWGAAAGIEKLYLRSEALSGSGTEVKGSHIINPHTGNPAGAHLAAWVRCPSAAQADALSTAFMIMSTADVRDFCQSHKDVSAFVVPAATGVLEKIG
ncbi:MAG: FAD:protein FMN transferase [Verrucomicrobia bacterium]|nr:FAD:protein FMN transferase [Verrucomicrobiota bacterium]